MIDALHSVAIDSTRNADSEVGAPDKNGTPVVMFVANELTVWRLTTNRADSIPQCLPWTRCLVKILTGFVISCNQCYQGKRPDLITTGPNDGDSYGSQNVVNPFVIDKAAFTITFKFDMKSHGSSPWSNVLHWKLVSIKQNKLTSRHSPCSYSKNPSSFTKPEGSLPYTHKRATCPS